MKWVSTEDFRQQLIRDATPCEKLVLDLLNHLKGASPEPWFIFQHPLPFGHYFADFYFPAEKVDLEIDGDIHKTPDRIQKDHIRDYSLLNHGVYTYRIQNGGLRDGRERETLNRFLNWLQMRNLPCNEILGKPYMKDARRKRKKKGRRKYGTTTYLRTGTGVIRIR